MRGLPYSPSFLIKKILIYTISSMIRLKHVSFIFIIASIFLNVQGCAEVDQSSGGVEYTIPPQPELPSGYNPKPGWATENFAVAAANPLAADAGYQILKAGGSAVDAAIAVQLVLTLVEPQSSGIGGGAFLLTWDGNEIEAYNGREIAPAGASEDQFLMENGEPMPFGDAVRSGKSVGVPGTVHLLKTAHDEHGVLPWKELFVPAITLAENGFNVSPRLHQLLSSDEALRRDPVASKFYYDEAGDAHPAGYLLKNPALADIYRNMSETGISAFYEGSVAEDIAERVQSHERPGSMVAADVNGYPALDLKTEAMCNDWLTYIVCGFPPPSSGHLTVMQILGIMEQLEEPDSSLADGLPTAEWLHQFLEASKLSFADRNKYIGDPQFVDAPGGDWNSMLAPEYLKERAQLVTAVSMESAEPGNPGSKQAMYGLQPFQPEYGTSHISIVDENGNAVSMTTTIESGFGSRIMSDGGTGLSGGFLLNNELTDFSLSPVDDEGNPIANRVEPGKRPRSSMSPSVIFDKETGDLVSLLGSPGGAAIIHYTAKTIVGMLQWNLNAQEAINLPNFVNYNSSASVLEEGYFPNQTIEKLTSMGHTISTQSLTSGIQAIQVTETGYFGGADPRREGVVKGE
jgi:gamma-glutamyltranspeptidase/glutathione hydrolase